MADHPGPVGVAVDHSRRGRLGCLDLLKHGVRRDRWHGWIGAEVEHERPVRLSAACQAP
jgi:hypothetical protein